MNFVVYWTACPAWWESSNPFRPLVEAVASYISNVITETV